MSERSPEEAIDDILEKRAEGDEPSEGERDFLESEGVRLDPDEEGNEPLAR